MNSQKEVASNNGTVWKLDACFDRLVYDAWNRGISGKYLESIALAKRLLEEEPRAMYAWDMIGNAYQSMSDSAEFSCRAGHYRRLAQDAWKRAASAHENADVAF